MGVLKKTCKFLTSFFRNKNVELNKLINSNTNKFLAIMFQESMYMYFLYYYFNFNYFGFVNFSIA